MFGVVHLCLQAAEAAEAVKVQQAKAAALAQKQVHMEQLEHMKQRILEERCGNTTHCFQPALSPAQQPSQSKLLTAGSPLTLGILLCAWTHTSSSRQCNKAEPC